MDKMFIPDCTVALVDMCGTCKNRRRFGYWCEKNSHVREQQYNVPFIVPDMEITSFGKWTSLKSKKMNSTFSIARSKFKDIVMGCGVLPGGKIPNQWWRYTNVGSESTLAWLGSVDGEYTP